MEHEQFSRHDISDIFDPISLENFMSDSYLRKPTLIKAKGSVSSNPITWSDINYILKTQRFDENRIRLICRGDIVESSNFLTRRRYRSGGSFFQVNVAGIEREMEGGGVLNIVAIDEMLDSVERLAKAVGLFFRGHVVANTYCATTITNGLTAHSDDHDVFVLQCQGAKRWSIEAQDNSDWRLKESGFVEGPSDTWSITCREGDWLYIPKGFGHHVDAVDAASIHVTFGLTRFTARDLMIWSMGTDSMQVVLDQEVPDYRDKALAHDFLSEMHRSINEHLNVALIERFNERNDELVGSISRPTLGSSVD